MNLRQLAGRGQCAPSETEPHPDSGAERSLTLLVEGAAMNMPAIDAETYSAFRANVGKLTMQMPDRLPDADKLALIRAVVHEFENYRNSSEGALRERLAGWRSLADTLILELLASLGIDSVSSAAAELRSKVAGLTASEDIRAYRTLLEEFLHPLGARSSVTDIVSPLKVADRSTANDNAAGLRGGGSAVEHLKRIIDHGGRGFIALFNLGCLDIIHERFGDEAVQDCLMEVSAFLTHSLRREDAIYHWSDSTLLAILQGRVSEQILAAELQRIANRNRDITVKIEGRIIMLRIPLAFELTAISSLRNADELYKLSVEQTAKW